MPNRLADQTSPYLLQHQQNPVDWFPWSQDALDAAAAADRPIFLSIGYAACHWCHVMERESFENEAIAAILNEGFVSVKVDREERPDLDQVYMEAVQTITRQNGGWPLSVFLTPEGLPFFGGTYWPPQAQWGRPGFADILHRVRTLWDTERAKIEQSAHEITAFLRARHEVEPRQTTATARFSETMPEAALSSESEERVTWTRTLARAGRDLIGRFDPVHGGFGSPPKFPHALELMLLTRLIVRLRAGDDELAAEANASGGPTEADLVKVVTKSLDAMARGGLKDQLAGGFARYSVDERWLVPHFEKMLYDNALLADAYQQAGLTLGNDALAEVGDETLAYLLDEMRDTQPDGRPGGLHSSEDADSEGVEGRFYVWTIDEVRQVLGDDPADRLAADRFLEAYGLTARGNFEGHNILFLPRPLTAWPADRAERESRTAPVFHGGDGIIPEDLVTELAATRRRLRQARAERVRPGRDDKVLTNWNGLALATLADAARLTGRRRDLTAAWEIADFLLATMADSPEGLLHTYRQGTAHQEAFLDDYAALIGGLTRLFEAGGRTSDLGWAIRLAEVMRDRFRAPDGGLFYTAETTKTPLFRSRDSYDGSVPSGTSEAAVALVRLGLLTGREDFLAQGAAIVGSSSVMVEQAPTAVSRLMIAVDLLRGPTYELVLVSGGDPVETAAARNVVSQTTLPAVWHLPPPPAPDHTSSDPSDDFASEGRAALTAQMAELGQAAVASLTSGKTAIDERATLYACQRGACQAPAIGLAAIEDQIRRLTTGV